MLVCGGVLGAVGVVGSRVGGCVIAGGAEVEWVAVGGGVDGADVGFCVAFEVVGSTAEVGTADPVGTSGAPGTTGGGGTPGPGGCSPAGAAVPDVGVCPLWTVRRSGGSPISAAGSSGTRGAVVRRLTIVGRPGEFVRPFSTGARSSVPNVNTSANTPPSATTGSRTTAETHPRPLRGNSR
ncbi:hypothetical protein DFJ66_4058 [Saccharothrix variisporea]|uniref:Uncharacterized protein n=1 Tax=Saccharothrix variisporea TaxID=543527 RepID=A0A495XBW0_9PSEU|nr:hypothetical protein DFJ66_4058 [Saccharothrix variisporea]